MKKCKFFSLLFCFLFVCSLSLIFFVPVSAYEVSSIYLQPSRTFDSYRAYVYTNTGLALRSSEPSVVYTSYYEVDLDLLNSIEATADVYSTFQSLSSSYKVSDAYDDPLYPYNGYLIPMIAVTGFNSTVQNNPIPLSYFDSYQVFYAGVFEDGGAFATMRNVLENGGSVTFIFQSLTPNPGFYVYSENAPVEPLYKSAWDLFVKFIYGEGVELTPEQILTLTLISTLAVLILVASPFLIVFGVIKGLFG